MHFFPYSIKRLSLPNITMLFQSRREKWAYNAVQKNGDERAGEIKGGVTSRKREGFPLPSAILRWTCRVTSWYFLSGLPSLLPAIFVSPPPPPSFFLPLCLTISGVVTRNKVILPLSGNTFLPWSSFKSLINHPFFFAYLLNLEYLFRMCLMKTFIGVDYGSSIITDKLKYIHN